MLQITLIRQGLPCHLSCRNTAALCVDGTRKSKDNVNFLRDWPNVIVSSDDTIRKVDPYGSAWDWKIYHFSFVETQDIGD